MFQLKNSDMSTWTAQSLLRTGHWQIRYNPGLVFQELEKDAEYTVVL